MSSGSGSGSGADQHLLALLRAIRLRQAAPEAVEAGAADTAAALSEIARREAGHGGRPATTGDEPPPPASKLPELTGGSVPLRPDWATSHPAAPDPYAAGDGDAGPRAAAADFFGRVSDTAPETDEPDLPEEAAASSAERAEDGYGTEGEDRAGRLSRNRFAGLGPGQAQREHPVPAPVPEPPAATTRVDRPAPAPETPAATTHVDRPRWAAGDQEPGPRPRVPHFEVLSPPMVATRTSAVDGMDPADDALLRQTQRLLGTSLTFAGGPGEVAARLRGALHQAHPSLLAILPGDAAAQSDRLAQGLVWLVHHLDQPPLLVSGCAALGKVLGEAGVEQDRLQLVGAALAEAMRTGMPPGEWRQEFDLAWRSTWQHLYEWIRHGEGTVSYDVTNWTAVVVSHELRRPDLAVIRVRPHLPMPFRPGQYARVEVPELPGIWRPYSLAGAPRRDDLIELHVRAKTTNGVSGTLVHRTATGDRLRLSRPEGEMRLPAAPDRDLLMIAGDTGVAPLKALLTELADTADPRSAVLFWGVRDLAELYDIDDIAGIARAAKRATVVPVISEGDPGPYASGLVTDAVAAYGEWSRHEVYLAGPPLMLASTSEALRRLGVAPDHIHHDAPE